MEAIWTAIQNIAPALFLQLARGILTLSIFLLLASIVRRLLGTAFRFANSAQRRVGAIVISAAHTAFSSSAL
jgi:hypothetical protein